MTTTECEQASGGCWLTTRCSPCWAPGQRCTRSTAPPTPALPGAHSSHGVVALLALRCLPASHLMHAPCDTLKYVGYLHSSQLERCVLGRLPFAHAAQRLPLDDTSTPLQATLQERRKRSKDTGV